jgi:tyrosinase
MIMRFLWSSLLLGCAIALAACTTADPLQPGTTRIRKNVKSLTSEEKADFVNAVKKLKTVQSPYDPAINYYDQFVKWHYLAFRCKPNNFDVHGYPAHMGPAFLPWHRVYLRVFEEALRDVSGKDITVPYWDWTDAASTSAVFADDFMGGSGDPANRYAVMTGPFRKGEWTVEFTDDDDVDSIFVDIETDPNPVPYLTRALGVNPAWTSVLPTAQDVATTLSVSTYDAAPWDPSVDTTKSFRNSLEGWRGKSGIYCDSVTKNMDAKANGSGLRSKMHNIVHVYVGGIFTPDPANQAVRHAGSMAQNTSPNDPIFWIHHSNIDRIWTAWMKRHGRSYLPVTGAPMGNNLNDVMEPWSYRKDGKNTPASVLDEEVMGFEYEALP